MAREFRHGPGIVERIPSPDELDQKELVPILLRAVIEMREEIDEILRHLQIQNAEDPWDFDEFVHKHEKNKQHIAEALKSFKG